MSDKRPLSEEAQRLLDARNSAIAELKAIDNVERGILDPHVIRLANARMFEESVSYRVLSGETVAASEVKAGADLVADARAAIPTPLPEIKVEIVSRTTTTCPNCHHTYDTLDYKPIKPTEPVVAIDASKPLVPNISDEDAATSHAKPDASHPTSKPPRYASIHDRLAFALEEDSRRICRPAAAYVSTVE